MVHSRKSDCLFNLRHGLRRKILSKRAKHSCVKLLAKDLDHLGPCACFGREKTSFLRTSYKETFGNPTQQAVIVFR